MSDNSKSNNLQHSDNAKGDSQVVMNYDAEKLRIPTYHRILVTDDGKEYSNKAINHAMAISNMSGAEVVLLRVIEDVSKIEDTSVKVEEGKEISNKPSSTDTAPKDFSENDDSKADNQTEDLKTTQSDISTPTAEYTTTNTSTDTSRSPTNSMSPSSASSLQTTIKGPMVEEMEDTIKACRVAGYKNKISYKFRAGEKIDQIVDEINSKDYDMVILTSKNINSWYKSLFSDTRKIIGNIDVPVLIAQ
ncbi:MAG: universal stress protein [Candidatus Nitrosocosmicus sp.]|nr:universal stress protein [Candidatus Nitrosocosmicus sp.]